MSRADERRLADQGHERDDERDDERRDAIGRRVDHAQSAIKRVRDELALRAGHVTRDDYRDLDRARLALERVKARHVGRFESPAIIEGVPRP